MIEIPEDMKKRMKEERLKQYQAQLFNLKMDLAAYTAVGDEEMISKTQVAIQQGEAAFRAVEEMA